MNHENVLKFYGTIKLKVSYMSNEYKFAFVMKYCEHNLKDIILKDRSVTPGRAEDLEVAVAVFLNWVVEIAAGLNYIHDRGLVHRHLKLENILVGINLKINFLNSHKNYCRIIFTLPERSLVAQSANFWKFSASSFSIRLGKAR